MRAKMNLRVCVFVALIASASLGFELLQTPVLSALYFNNVVYMTVTIRTAWLWHVRRARVGVAACRWRTPIAWRSSAARPAWGSVFRPAYCVPASTPLPGMDAAGSVALLDDGPTSSW